MTAETLMSRTGTLISVTESTDEDVYGNLEDAETETAVRYELQQTQRDETGDPGSWQIGTWRLFVPAGTPVAGVDRFIDDQGAAYSFEGPPWPVHNPRTGRTSHIEATLRQST